MNSKYNWNEIVKDSKKIIHDTTKNGNRKLISTMKELYDRLKFQYEKKGKEVPRYVLYSEKIRKEFNIDCHKKNIQLELYWAVAAHGKILLKTLSQNITISYPNVASQAVWLFIRLKETKETEEKNISLEDYNSHFYYLSKRLKEQFKDEILFLSFDTDTVALLCKDDPARKKSSAISENYILIWKCFNRGSIWQIDPKPMKPMKKFARSLQNIFSHTKSMCKTGKINCQIRDLPPIYDSLCPHNLL